MHSEYYYVGMSPDGMERSRGEKKEGKDSSKDKLTRRQILGLGAGGAAFAAANAGMWATVGVDTQRKYEEQRKIDGENTFIRKALVLGKGSEGGSGSAAEGFVQGAAAGSIMGPGAAVMMGAGSAVQGSYNSEKKYWVKFKVDAVNDTQATQTHYISKEQYEKWNTGDQIDVKVVTEANDATKLRSIRIEGQ